MDRGSTGQRSIGHISFGTAALLYACAVYDPSLVGTGSSLGPDAATGATGDGVGTSGPADTSSTSGESATGTGGTDIDASDVGSAGGASGSSGGAIGTGGDATGSNAATGAGGLATGGASSGAGGATGGSGPSVGGAAGTTTGASGAGGASMGGAGASAAGGASATGGASGSASTGGTAGNAGTGGSATGGTSGSAGAAGSVVVDGGASICTPACLSATGCPARSCWVATANPTLPPGYLNIANDHLLPPYAIDGNEVTRYTTGENGSGDEWFQVDLCRAVSISSVTAYTTPATDVPASYTVQVSMDGANWTTLINSPSPPMLRMALTFPPVVARYVRYNQTGTMGYWWSIQEFGVVCAP